MPYALLYRSVSTYPIGTLGMQALSVRSAQRNREAGITGLLLHGLHTQVEGVPGAFVQWIEGPEDEVRELFHSIESDDRHSGIEILASGSVQGLTGGGRLFPDWGMRTEAISDLPASLEGFLAHVRQRPLAQAA